MLKIGETLPRLSVIHVFWCGPSHFQADPCSWVLDLIIIPSNQAILHSISEANNPDVTNYYTLNKENPVHIDIEDDPEQTELDQEEFPDDNPEGAGPGEAPDPISLEARGMQKSSV